MIYQSTRCFINYIIQCVARYLTYILVLDNSDCVDCDDISNNQW